MICMALGRRVIQTDMEGQTGRTQLRDVLEELVSQRRDNKQDDHLDIDEDVEEAARELLEYSSPRKKPYKQRRKRKRAQRDSLSDTFSDEERETSSSEVISIYGRHLNLSRLGKKPSLYSVCRDWVQNDPLGQVHLTSASQPNVSDVDSDNNRHQFGDKLPIICKIPKPVVDISVMDRNLNSGLSNDEVPSLRTSYLKKWKHLRSRFNEASAKT